MAVRIPLAEFKRRQQQAQRLMKKEGWDGLLIQSDEAEFANVRYFSDYWPLFETAGVFIPATGKPHRQADNLKGGIGQLLDAAQQADVMRMFA